MQGVRQSRRSGEKLQMIRVVSNIPTARESFEARVAKMPRIHQSIRGIV